MLLNHYHKEDRAFVKRVSRLKGHFFTKFLNMNEQEIIQHFHKDVEFVGGYDLSERKRAYVGSKPEIVCFEVFVSSKNEIEHKHVYGSFMNSGIEQDHFGDIIVQDNHIYVFVTQEIADYVEFNVQINHLPTRMMRIDASTFQYKERLSIDKLFISSVRLDNFISNVYNVSRNEAKALISKKFVRVNAKTIENISHEVLIGDIVSVRTKGRFKVLELEGESKKGNLIFKVGKY